MLQAKVVENVHFPAIKLRCELPDDYKQRIYAAIDELKQREA